MFPIRTIKDNDEAKAFTIEILKEMQRLQKQWTKQYDIWFSIYFEDVAFLLIFQL
jgi:general stress protein 26